MVPGFAIITLHPYYVFPGSIFFCKNRKPKYHLPVEAFFVFAKLISVVSFSARWGKIYLLSQAMPLLTALVGRKANRGIKL